MSTNYRYLKSVINVILSVVFSIGITFAAPAIQLASSHANSPDGPQPGPQYTVNDASDPGGGVCNVASCSLRAAITAANAAAGAHSIIFNLAYPATITLSSLLPTMQGSLTIAGPGPANLTLSGAGLYRGLKVGSGATVHLSGISIQQGYDDIQGGGILVNHGSLTIENVVIANSAAGGGNGGGLNNISGNVTISFSTFDSNFAFHDGGITNSGNITIDNSVFSNNHARTGGAIDNTGNLLITNSTFSGNIAGQISGGAIQNNGSLVIANSTFTDNGSSRGADISNGGVLNVTNSTFYLVSSAGVSAESIANGGVGAVATLRNSIIAAGDGVVDCSNQPGGVLTVNASNLATDASCGSATFKSMAQLNLGALDNYGGSTPTIALLPGSQAMDAGSDTVCAAAVGAPGYGAGASDQRGVTRPQGAACDAGAFEADYQVGSSLIVNNASDPGAVLCMLSSCSLRAAVTLANADGMAGVHQIGFDLATPVTITLSSALPVITGTLTINGLGAVSLGVSGADQFRVLEVSAGATLFLSDIAIRHGSELSAGGLLNDHGSLTLTNVLFADNRATGGDGGGLNNQGGTVTITNNTFADNQGFHDGGIANSGTMSVADSTFSNNHARTGGAIENSSGGSLTVTGSTFSGNIGEPISGGAIQNEGTLVLANSTFVYDGGPVGGDIANDNGTVHVTNSTFYSDTLPTASSIENTGALAQVSLLNSILAAGGGIANCASSGGALLTAAASDLATDGTCPNATLTTLVLLNLSGLSYVGGKTPTIALMPGSAAIDNGNDALCADAVGSPQYGAGGVDQRGVPRPQGPHCDVGAFEYFPILSIYMPLIDK